MQEMRFSAIQLDVTCELCVYQQPPAFASGFERQVGLELWERSDSNLTSREYDLKRPAFIRSGWKEQQAWIRGAH